MFKIVFLLNFIVITSPLAKCFIHLLDNNGRLKFENDLGGQDPLGGLSKISKYV